MNGLQIWNYITEQASHGKPTKYQIYTDVATKLIEEVIINDRRN